MSTLFDLPHEVQQGLLNFVEILENTFVNHIKKLKSGILSEYCETLMKCQDQLLKQA